MTDPHSPSIPPELICRDPEVVKAYVDDPLVFFRDVPVGSTFFRYVETAYARGVISGYTCGPSCLEFRPGNSATRGQISKIVYAAIIQP